MAVTVRVQDIPGPQYARQDAINTRMSKHIRHMRYLGLDVVVRISRLFKDRHGLLVDLIVKFGGEISLKSHITVHDKVPHLVIV